MKVLSLSLFHETMPTSLNVHNSESHQNQNSKQSCCWWNTARHSCDGDGSLQRSPSQHVTPQLFSCNIGIPCKAVCTFWQVCVLSVLHSDITEQLRT